MLWYNNTPDPGGGLIREMASPQLDLLRLELVFRTTDVCWLPPFRGSLWRSVLGPALKRLDKTGNWRPPVGCGIPQSLYQWVFDTPVSSCLLAPRGHGVPHPLIIDAPTRGKWQFVEPGKTMRIQLTFPGRFANAWQAIVTAFADAARKGLGKAITGDGRRGRAQLISVHQVWAAGRRNIALWNAENGWIEETPQSAAYPAPPACGVHVDLVSPLRVIVNKQPVQPDRFTAADLFVPLIRRTGALMASLGGVYLDVNVDHLARRAKNLPLANKHLDLQKARRWSANQNDKVPCDGLTGRFDLDLSSAPDLFEFLWLAQWINIGKGASIGLGNIRISPL